MIGFMLAALLIQDGQAMEAETVPPLVTIEQLHRLPHGWNGLRVRIAGYFNECRGYNCRICDDANIHNERNDDGPTSWSSPYCAGVEAFAGGRPTDDAVRHSYALIEATYSTRCSGDVVYDFETGTLARQTIALCSDRAGELTEPALVQVLERDVHPLPLVTIEQLHRERDIWIGRSVRMIVRAGECHAGCTVCDEPEDQSIWPDSPEFPVASGLNEDQIAEWEASHCSRVRFVGGYQGEDIARFNTVELMAQFDGFGRCYPIEQFPRLAQRNPDRERYCAGNFRTELSNAVVLEIINARPATDFETDAPPQYRMATDAERASIEAEFLRHRGRFDEWLDETFPNVQTEIHVIISIQNENFGALCILYPENGEVVIPTRGSHLLESIGTNYHCYAVEKVEDVGWIFQL